MAKIEHGERTCELCGRLMGDGWELERHMHEVHGHTLSSVDLQEASDNDADEAGDDGMDAPPTG